MRIALLTSYDLGTDSDLLHHILSLATMLRAAGELVWVLGPTSGVVPAGCIGWPGGLAVPTRGATLPIGLWTSPTQTLAFLRKQHIEVVHVHDPLVPGPARWALAYRFARRIVATFHAYAEHEPVWQTKLRWLVSRPLRNIDVAFAIGDAAARFAQPIYRKPLQIIGPSPSKRLAPADPFDWQVWLPRILAAYHGKVGT